MVILAEKNNFVLACTLAEKNIASRPTVLSRFCGIFTLNRRIKRGNVGL